MGVLLEQYKARGFKVYQPRPDRLKYLYELTENDLRQLPTGEFETSFGARQPVQMGDYLAMPCPDRAPTEIYMMPRIVVQSCYKLVHPLTQADMLGLCRERILAQGQLVKKQKVGLARPGRKGERISTCLGNRVTSEVVV